MKKTTYGQDFLKELEMEESATRKCLERMRDDLFEWKPHDKSMTMGNVASIVAAIPQWITLIAETEFIDFVTYRPSMPKTVSELIKYFDENIKEAKKALKKISDEDLNKQFSLKEKDIVLMSSPKYDSILSSINHLVHHRGQFTVYMRLNDIAVPSIYGPSADENPWIK